MGAGSDDFHTIYLGNNVSCFCLTDRQTFPLHCWRSNNDRKITSMQELITSHKVRADNAAESGTSSAASAAEELLQHCQGLRFVSQRAANTGNTGGELQICQSCRVNLKKLSNTSQ